MNPNVLQVDVPAGILDVRGTLNEYVVMEGPRQSIRRDFQHFLTSFLDANGESVYGERIKSMCEGANVGEMRFGRS